MKIHRFISVWLAQKSMNLNYDVKQAAFDRLEEFVKDFGKPQQPLTVMFSHNNTPYQALVTLGEDGYALQDIQKRPEGQSTLDMLNSLKEINTYSKEKIGIVLSASPAQKLGWAGVDLLHVKDNEYLFGSSEMKLDEMVNVFVPGRTKPLINSRYLNSQSIEMFNKDLPASQHSMSEIDIVRTVEDLDTRVAVEHKAYDVMRSVETKYGAGQKLVVMVQYNKKTYLAEFHVDPEVGYFMPSQAYKLLEGVGSNQLVKYISEKNGNMSLEKMAGVVMSINEAKKLRSPKFVALDKYVSGVNGTSVNIYVPGSDKVLKNASFV